MTIPRIARADLARMTVRVLRPGKWNAPEVRLLDFEGRPAVLKDWADRPLATRLTIGWPLVRLETGILRRLLGLEGVPQLLATVDRNAFVMSWLDARPVYKVPPAELPPGIFADLLTLVDAMHARGVVHLDLRQRKNVLVDSRGRATLIDFASSLHFGREGRVFRFLRLVDRTAILKLKNRVRPADVTEEEKEALRSFDRMRKFWVIKFRRKNAKDRLD